VFGDAAQRVILAAAQADRAALVILAIPENDRARLAVQRIRAFNPTVQILARVHDVAWRARLMEAGAAEVIQPEQEAASTLIRHALERLSLPRDRVLAYLNRYRGAMESVEADREVAGAAGLPQIRQIVLKGGRLVGQSLREVRMREGFGVIVVRVTRATGEEVLNPTADTVLRAGDRLRLFGLPRQIDALLAGTHVRAD
jgi:CPA2 family monovalent cation:H+ antiporter-2